MLAVVTALGGLPASAETPEGIGCLVPGIDDRCETWSHQFSQAERETPNDVWYGDPFTNRTYDRASHGAVSHSGAVAFVAGINVDWPSSCVNGSAVTFRYETVAYDVASGAVLWHAQVPAPDCTWDALSRAVAVSADDSTVFVTGTIVRGVAERDIFVVAHDAQTGALRWSAVYQGAFGGIDDSFAIATSPTDDRVFVAGAVQASAKPVKSTGATPLYLHRDLLIAMDADVDYALLTFDGTSGSLLSSATHAGPSYLVDGTPYGSWDVPTDIVVDPTAMRIALAGTSDGRASYRDSVYHAAIAVFEADGGAWAPAWSREVTGIPLGFGALASSYALLGTAPAGATAEKPFAVAAFGAATGAALWETPFDVGGRASDIQRPRGLAVDAVRDAVFATGLSGVFADSAAAGVLALDGTSGATKWRVRHTDPRTQATIVFNYDSDERPSIAVDPTNGDVRMTHLREGEIRTVAIDRLTGATNWTAVYDYPEGEATGDRMTAPWHQNIAVSSTGWTVVFGTVYVQLRDWCRQNSVSNVPTPWVPWPCTRDDILTVAYRP